MDFLGRILRHEGNSITIKPSSNYIKGILQMAGMDKSRSVTTPGCRSTTEEEGLLDRLEAKNYRQITGNLMWLVPIRPDINYAVNELARSLHQPPKEDFSRLKRVLRYIHGYPVLQIGDLPTGRALQDCDATLPCRL